MKEIFHRTSVRQFQDKAVEQEKVEKLLQAAMQAPSAGNQRPWSFYVVRNKEVLDKLSKAAPYGGCIKNAPMAIVIAYETGSAMFPELCEVDCAIATENIWLEADALGLGTVMIAYAPYEERMNPANEALNLSEGKNVFTVLPIGYPVKENAQKSRYEESRVTYVD